MNLKSKAINEIRATIIMLAAQLENVEDAQISERIKALNYLLGGLLTEEESKGVPTSQEIEDAAENACTNKFSLIKGNNFRDIAMEEAAFTDGHTAGAQWAISQMQPGWVPIDQYPDKGIPLVLRWHKFWNCPVAVQHRRAFADSEGEWLDGTRDHFWPESAFEPFFQHLPQPPTK